MLSKLGPMAMSSVKSRYLNIENAYLGLWILVLFLSAIKMRGYIPEGRFWAEEGKYFYVEIASRDGLSGLFYLFNGHLEFVTNLVVWISLAVDFESAPQITTFLSWLIQLLPVAIFIHFREQLGLSVLRTACVVFATAAIPQSSEVWANSINLHFHFALLTGIIALLPAHTVRQVWLFRVLLLLAGLSGIPANVLFPIFVLVAYQSRNREKWIQAGILGVTTALQLAILVGSDFAGSEREITTDPRILWFVLVAQHLVAPLVGKSIGKKLIEPMQDVAAADFTNVDMVGWSVVVICTFLYGVMVYIAWRSRRWHSLYCFLGGVWLAAFCTLASIGDRALMISLHGGGRYLFASNLLLVLGFVMLIPKTFKRRWNVVVAVWLLALMPGVTSYLGGKSWLEALQESERAGSEKVEIWPRGWFMERATIVGAD